LIATGEMFGDQTRLVLFQASQYIGRYGFEDV
jgi:hypothetical protein